MSSSQHSAGKRSFEVVEGRKGQLQVMIVAGEASSDQHGAALVKSLKRIRPEISVFGMGGSALREAGAETVIDSEHAASVMGVSELFGNIRRLMAAFRLLVDTAKQRKPSLVVLIDFPDFNLRFAKAMRRLGIPVLYFVSPQLWAWRKGRVRAMKRDVKKVVPIFPFEESFYHRHGVDAEYVGHPFADGSPVSLSREEFLQSLGIDPQLPVLALLPGSRRSEVERLLEPLLGAFQLLRSTRPGFQALLPVPPTLDIEEVRRQVGNAPGVTVVDGRAREVLASSRLAVIASGTASVEAAFAGTPMIVVYRLATFTHLVARLLVRGVKHFAMVNLIAGKQIVPELLQEAVCAERIFREMEKILGNQAEEQKQREGLALVRDRLKYPGEAGETTADRVAKIVLDLMEPPRSSGGPAAWRRGPNVSRSSSQP